MKRIGALFLAAFLAGCGPQPVRQLDAAHPDTATVKMRSGEVLRIPVTEISADNQTLTLYRGGDVVFRARWDTVDRVTSTARRWFPE